VVVLTIAPKLKKPPVRTEVEERALKVRATQAQLLIPLVASLAFGLLTATLFSLFLIPACFVILDELGRFRMDDKTLA